MNLIRLVVLILSLNAACSFGQYNLNVGYDFGSFAHPSYSGQKNFNFVHRLNISGEYVFKSNIILSLIIGYDLHNIRYEKFNTIGSNTTGGVIIDEVYHRDLNIEAFKTGISLGYEFDLGTSSKIGLKLSVDGFIINNISLLNLNKEERYYDNLIEQDNEKPFKTTIEHDPNLIDMEKIRTPNRYFILSFHYKYKIKSYFISPQIGFSPWNEGFILPSGQSLLLAGIRLGYTFSQKSDINEK